MHSDQFSLGMGSIVGGTLKWEKKKNKASQAKRYSLGREKGLSKHSTRFFMPFQSVFCHFFPAAEPGFRVRSAWKQFFCSQKILWNVDARAINSLRPLSPVHSGLPAIRPTNTPWGWGVGGRWQILGKRRIRWGFEDLEIRVAWMKTLRSASVSIPLHACNRISN